MRQATTLTNDARAQRAEAFSRATWEGCRVRETDARGGRIGTIVARWADDHPFPVTAESCCAVKFDGYADTALVRFADLTGAPVACAYDPGATRAELSRCKVKPASAKCGTVYTPDMPTEDDRARCPACAALERKLWARRDRQNRRRYLADVRKARATMPRLYAELQRIQRTRTVFYLIPHVARSGMSRRIELFYPQKGGGVDVVWPDYEPGEGTTAHDLETLRKRIDWSRRHRCFVIGGCGMDMVFALVDHLGSVFGFENWGNKIRRNGLSRAE